MDLPSPILSTAPLSPETHVREVKERGHQRSHSTQIPRHVADLRIRSQTAALARLKEIANSNTPFKKPVPVEDRLGSEQTTVEAYSNKGATAVYGFVGFLTSTLAFCIWLLWAYLPEKTLFFYGVHYFPSRWWTLAIPAWLCVAYIMVPVIYYAINFMRTPGLESTEFITDSHAKRREQRIGEFRHQSKIPPLIDIPIGTVNQVLYQ